MKYLSVLIKPISQISADGGYGSLVGGTLTLVDAWQSVPAYEWGGSLKHIEG